MAYLTLQKRYLLLLSQWRWALHGEDNFYVIIYWRRKLPYLDIYRKHITLKDENSLFSYYIVYLPDFYSLSTQWITCVFSIIVIERGEDWFERTGSAACHCPCSMASWVRSLWKSCGIQREPPFSVTDITFYHPISAAYFWARDLSYVNFISVVHLWARDLSYVNSISAVHLWAITYHMGTSNLLSIKENQ